MSKTEKTTFEIQQPKRRGEMLSELYFILGVIFLTAFGVFLRTYYYEIYPDEINYSDNYILFIIVLRRIFDVVTVAFVLSHIVFRTWKKKALGGAISAAFFSLIYLANKGFGIFWDVEKGRLSDARNFESAIDIMLVELLYFATLYFAAFLVTLAIRVIKEAKERGKKKSDVKARRQISVFHCLAVSSIINMGLNLIAPVRYHVEKLSYYDEITGSDMALFAGDVLLVLLEQGVAIFAVACVGYILLDRNVLKSKKFAENELKNVKDSDKS